MNTPAAPASHPAASRAGAKATTDADRRLGRRIAALRRGRGIAQADLGAALGVSYQQVQKYEKGTNRVGAGRMQDVARFFEVPVSTFYEEEGGSGAAAEAFALLTTPGAIELLRAYEAIPNAQDRHEVLGIVRAVARIGSTTGEHMADARQVSP